jgi:hypothetical protein
MKLQFVIRAHVMLDDGKDRRNASTFNARGVVISAAPARAVF